jgi:hypothetical protein
MQNPTPSPGEEPAGPNADQHSIWNPPHDISWAARSKLHYSLNHAQESSRVAQGAFPQLFAFGSRGARRAFECLSRINALTFDRAETRADPCLDRELRQIDSRPARSASVRKRFAPCHRGDKEPSSPIGLLPGGASVESM